MPPVISFNHSNLYANTGLVPSGSFHVGHPTSITITLLNSGDDGIAIVHLWWIGPCLASTTGPMSDLVNGGRLALPIGPGNQIAINAVHSVGGTAVVSWTPSATDFPHALGSAVPGCLFAQAEIKPNLPYTGDPSALTNWSPAYSLCAQHNIQINT